jgi:glucose/arabinose dehydrogenase
VLLTERPALQALLLPLLATVLLLASACSGDDDNAFQGSTPTAATVAPSAQATASAASPTARAPDGDTIPTATPAPELPQINLQRIFPDLNLQRMTGMYQDSGGNWYVTEQAGRVQRIDAASGKANVWLDLTDRVDSSGNEMGLLGLALAPDFETSHAFYVDYTGGGQTVISRFHASDDGLTVDPAGEQQLLKVDQPFSNHNGGQLAFGPDGYLYIGLGDGGSGNDPNGNGQNLNVLLAKVLRIDVSGDDATYDIPQDNPFAGRNDARGEIWAYGFRNPWRFSFDRNTGELWVGDVGQNSREEIDLVERGGNYGWKITEGFDCRGGTSDCDKTGLLPPVFDYATGSGGTCAVTGGFVYHAAAIPDLQGAYVFSDYCSGEIYALRAAGTTMTQQATIAETDLNVSSLAQDNNGELYALDLANGGIYRLAP